MFAQVVKQLVASGADLTARNGSGNTPLQEAEVVVARIDNDASGAGDDIDSYVKVVSYLTKASQEEGATTAGMFIFEHSLLFKGKCRLLLSHVTNIHEI